MFDDGDEKTLRRSSLCLQGEKHFHESEVSHFRLDLSVLVLDEFWLSWLDFNFILTMQSKMEQ